ncbi:MAG: integrase [Candidatus Baldrarchaeota archaeon]
MNPGNRLGRLYFEKESKMDEINYNEVREDFISWMYERCSKEHVDNLVRYLDKYLTKTISSPKELFFLIKSVKKGKRHLCMGIRDLLKFYETFDLMSEESLAKYRRVVKIPKTNVDDYVPGDEKVVLAFKRFRNESYRVLFKLLAFSGIRLKEALYLLNNFNKDRLIVNRKVAKYPLSLDRRTKKIFYVYMPKSFALKLKPIKITESAAKKYFSINGLPAKYLRKWNYNFLILNGVPESVADFIQGRTSITIGAMHYLAKVKQADEWYSKIANKLIKMF